MADLRFGVGVGGGPGGRYWSMKFAASRPEVFLYGSETGGFFGISLHEDPDHWHWKIHRPGERATYEEWPRPPQLVPGYTRALTLSSSPSYAAVGTPVAKQ